MKLRLSWCAGGLCFLSTLSGYAQDVTTVLAGLTAQAREYQRSIPNFTCTEVVTTTAKRDGKVEKHVEFQAIVRVHRKEDRSLEETFSITNFMGRPTPQGGKFDLPLYMSGGLSEGLPSFFEQGAQACYTYQSSDQRIEFRASENAKCKEIPGTTGFALVDADGKLLHGELRRPRDVASRQRVAALARADYGDVRLDDRIFRMPIHVYGEDQRGGTLLTFDAYYTACTLFTAKTTIRPGDGLNEPPTP